MYETVETTTVYTTHTDYGCSFGGYVIKVPSPNWSSGTPSHNVCKKDVLTTEDRKLKLESTKTEGGICGIPGGNE